MKENNKIIFNKGEEHTKEIMIAFLKQVENGKCSYKDAIEHIKNYNYYVRGTFNYEKYSIPIDKIMYISLNQGVTNIYTPKGLYNDYHTLLNWEQELKKNQFINFCRIHRDTILNLNYLNKEKSRGTLNHNVIILNDGEKLIISQRKKANVIKMINSIS